MAAVSGDIAGSSHSALSLAELRRKHTRKLASEIDKIKFNLTSDEDQRSSQQVVDWISKYLSQAVNTNPEWFCLPKNSDSPAEAAECLAFTEWLIRFLLNLFSQPPPQSHNPQAAVPGNVKQWIFDRCVHVLVKLLRLVAVNDTVSFNKLQTSLAKLAVDLIRFRLSRTRSGDIHMAGNRLSLNHFCNFEPDPTLRWQRVTLTCGSSEHEVDNLILGVVVSLNESRSCSQVPLKKTDLDLFFQMGVKSEMMFVKDACFALFTAQSDWQTWPPEKVISFLNQSLTPFIWKNGRPDSAVTGPVSAALSTIFQILVVTQNEDVWRQQLMLWLIRIGWKCDENVHAEVRQHIRSIAKLLGFGIETKYLFHRDAASLIPQMMDLLLKEAGGTPENTFMTGITLFGDCFNAVFKHILFKAVTCDPSDEKSALKLMNKIVYKSGSKMEDLIRHCYPQMCAMLIEKYDNWDDILKRLIRIVLFQTGKMNKKQQPEWMRNPMPRLVAREVLFHINQKRQLVLNMIDRFSDPKSRVEDDASLNRFLVKNPILSHMIATATYFVKRGIEQNRNKIMSLIDLIQIGGKPVLLQAQTQIAPLLNYCVGLQNLSVEEYALIGNLYAAYLDNVPFEVLQENLLLICKDIYEQLLPKHKQQAVFLLEKVICGNSVRLGRKLREVSFVRSRRDADFEKLNTAIDQACRNMMEVNHSDFINERISEIRNARETLLKILKIGDLRNYISRNYEHVIAADAIPSYISQLVSVLLKDAKQPAPELALAIARCLGEIGAIDPGRFDAIPASGVFPENQILHHDTGSPAFMKELMTRVSRSNIWFCDPNSQLLIMYVLQELVRFMEIEDHCGTGTLMEQLPEDVRRECENVTDSQYKIPEDIIRKEVNRIPPESTVFSFKDEHDSDLPLKYEKWLRLWANRMILKMSPRSTCYKILYSCASFFATDYRLTESLLPCIIFNFLSDKSIPSDEKELIVFDEISAVIRSAVPEEYQTRDPHTFNNSSCNLAAVVVSAPVLSELEHLSSQMIFVVYETLQEWSQSKRVDKVDELFDLLKDKGCLAHLAYACRSHARSILYLEKGYPNVDFCHLPPADLQLLQKNFIALDEPDAVMGVDECRTSCPLPSEIDRIMAFESTCHLLEALNCCRMAKRNHPDDVVYRKIELRILLSLDMTSDAYNAAAALMSKKPEWKRHILPLQIQAAWRLSMWSELTQLLEQADFQNQETCMNVHFGRILSHISHRNVAKLRDTLNEVREIAMNPIAAVASEKGAYTRCYNSLIKLHMLTDMQRAALDLCDMEAEPNNRHESGPQWLGTIWKLRNKVITASSQTLEPVLIMQRVLLSVYPAEKQKDLAKELIESWLTSAKIARKSGNQTKANQCIEEIRSLTDSQSVDCTDLLSRVLLEAAKCYWAGDAASKENAIKYLRRHMDRYFCDVIAKKSNSSRTAPKKDVDNDSKCYARVRLLLTKFLAMSQTADNQTLEDGYTQAMDAHPKWEKPAFLLGRLFDDIACDTTDHTERANLMAKACKFYSKSLERGCKYIYQSLPRLIDLWCELGTAEFFFRTALRSAEKAAAAKLQLTAGSRKRPSLSSMKTRSNDQIGVNEELKQTTENVMKAFANVNTDVFDNIHVYQKSEHLYTALPHLLSRISHTNVSLTTRLRNIVARIVSQHPHQCMWHLLPAIMSEDRKVAHAAEEIVREVVKIDATLIPDVAKLREAGKCFRDVAGEGGAKKVIRLSDLKSGKKLKEFLTLNRFLLPYRQFMRVTMPPGGIVDENHQYFADRVMITGVEEGVHVFNSVANPKRITVTCSDGKKYPLLVKPKDDMRMDSRVMELIEVVNRLLHKDPESRKRQLRIRSFHVVPLGSCGGVVEFIDGVRDIRQILLNEYSRLGKINSKTIMGEVNQRYPAPSSEPVPSSAARHQYKDLMSKFEPPVLSGWFRDQFPNASEWLAARTEFTRSLAVMSIVGYVIGLGDRHLENILMDTKTGQIIHVDFTVLFDGGLLLTVPELVPFRLTHNLVDAMGLTKYEGVFRKVCETTLQVMRNNRQELISVLKPIVYKPFAELNADQVMVEKSAESKVHEMVAGRSSAAAHEIEKLEVCNEKAAQNLMNIDQRLRGRIIRNNEPNHLSVSGHVSFLIQEATDVNKLLRMFKGWASYL